MFRIRANNVIMEDAVTEKCSSVAVENQELKNTESAENFQKFIYELFENNGVLSDLRAYLRGHIVEVLRSTKTGEPPTCQKHFTQRLELQFQALNILIVEYLLRMEFNYSLSVFISEIPLANMVFGYAKSIMQTTKRDPGLKFDIEDVWSILNYLGIKCDSNHALNILDMYRGDKKLPLLLCILQCLPMFKEPNELKPESSQESILFNEKGIETLEQSQTQSKTYQSQSCKHYALCQTCQDKIAEVKEHYEMEQKDLIETARDFDINSQNVETLLKNVDETERSVIVKYHE